jgi:hypothetical protein
MTNSNEGLHHLLTPSVSVNIVKGIPNIKPIAAD